MKLRILDNSVRLRLTKSEVEKIKEFSEIHGTTQLPLSSFNYSLRAEGKEYSISHDSRGLHLSVPIEVADSWANSNRVGFRHSFDTSEGGKLNLLIEKDFQCLTDTDTADKSDFYEHPYSKKED